MRRYEKIRLLALLAILASPAPVFALPATEALAPCFFVPLDIDFDEELLNAEVPYWNLPDMWSLPPLSIAPIDPRYSDFDAAMRINRGLFLGFGEQALPNALGGVVTAPHVGGFSTHVLGIGSVYAPGGLLPGMSQVEIKSSTIVIQTE